MSGRLGIDFGTSNTVIAVWDEAAHDAQPLHIPDFGRPCVLGQPAASEASSGSNSISIVPSVIHYAADGRRWIGEQVCERKLLSSDRTFSLIKRYIVNRSPVSRRLDGRQVFPAEAAADFLTALLLFSSEELKLGDEEIGLTAPVEAYEHYVDWLTRVAESARWPRFRLIDEPSAAALGYGANIQPGQVYLIIDFGGGTLDVSVILIEENPEAKFGRRCRVLGKAGRDLGGCTIDTWLLQEVLRRNGCRDSDDDVRPISSELLLACRAAKEQLTYAEKAEVTVSGRKTVAAVITRAEFEELLDGHNAFSQLDKVIRRALNAAHERGYAEEHIQSVLMVGGSSLIPSVQKTVRRIFDKEKVRLERPMDAVARGAAAFVAGVDFYDHIQHDYAVRWVNPRKGDYDYHVIVRRGTAYPTSEPVSRLSIKATHAGQTELGLAIFELGERREKETSGVELVFDPSGAARIVPVSADEDERRSCFWVNEQNPTFLQASPPAQPGEQRFVVEFGIDPNKRLVITAQDLKTGRITHRDHPVIKLT